MMDTPAEEIQPATYRQIVDAMKWVCSDAVKRERHLKKRIKQLEAELEAARRTRLPASPVLPSVRRVVHGKRPADPIEKWREHTLGIQGYTKNLSSRTRALLGGTSVYIVEGAAVLILGVPVTYEQLACGRFTADAWTVLKMMIDPEDVCPKEMVDEAKALVAKWAGGTSGRSYVYSHGFATIDEKTASEVKRRLNIPGAAQWPGIILPRSTSPEKISELLAYANALQ
jgi:hypothetical protein